MGGNGVVIEARCSQHTVARRTTVRLRFRITTHYTRTLEWRVLATGLAQPVPAAAAAAAGSSTHHSKPSSNPFASAKQRAAQYAVPTTTDAHDARTDE